MDLSNIYNIQKNYFLMGNTLPVSFRKQQLKKLYDAINRYEDAIVDALKKDLGKSREESYMSEIGMVKTEITHMLKHITSYSKKKYVSTPLAQFLSFSYKKSIPYGTTLIMSPWNYPFLLTLDPLVCAIAAGDTAVLKPGPASMHTNAIMKKMIEETYDDELLEGCSVLHITGKKISEKGWDEGTLYQNRKAELEDVKLTLVPYCYWGNRTTGEMLVWMKELRP